MVGAIRELYRRTATGREPRTSLVVSSWPVRVCRARRPFKVFDSVEDRLQQHRGKFAPLSGQVDAVFVFGGQVAGVELFDAVDTLGKLLPKLVDSYLFDALDSESEPAEAKPPSLAEVSSLLERIANAHPAVYTAVAKGVDLRIERPDLHAAALADGERVVHLSAFEQTGPAAEVR